MVMKDGRAYIQAGCGVVADSVPSTEYEECLNKARALLRALDEAERIADSTAHQSTSTPLPVGKGL
jgi:anthranilate synthase component 1